LDADEKNLSVEEKKKKKKLIDGMKRKVKGRNTEDEDELEVLGVKSRASFKMEAECLIFFH
jgi:acyl CoA:acetate/3-ketoacid CoA transferase